MVMRNDGRRPDQLRPLKISTGISPYAEGSALIVTGQTQVLCTASVEEQLPAWLRGQGRGWVTAEYALLPRSTQTRVRRERDGAGGRTQEIQRLIGRSLRAAIDLEALGERLITIDCDVLVADGGTRTAAISGGYVALALAVSRLMSAGRLARNPLRTAVAAISVGLVNGIALLDLDYSEDKAADVDMNVVQTASGAFVELQGTAEGMPFSHNQLDMLLTLAAGGIKQLLEAQSRALA